MSPETPSKRPFVRAPADERTSGWLIRDQSIIPERASLPPVL
jgi:hypothetical protein